MTDVKPFRALRYTRKVELSRVLAPVYDVVAPEDRPLYWDRDPHNALRLELTKSVEDEADTDYRETADRLAEWRDAGVLARDAVPALYVLRQSFVAPGGAHALTPDGQELARTGFLAALRLEDYAKRVVRPHEKTLAGPKADRLKILRATRANLSGVFMLYEDRANELEATFEAALASEAAVEAKDDAGIVHRLAPLVDGDAVARIVDFLAPRPVVIADGHHRYETALAFRDERRDAGAGDAEAPHERILAYFANAFAPGSLLLPIHRLVRKGPPPGDAVWRRLTGWEQREVALDSAEAVPELLARHLAPLADRHAFAADDGAGRLRIFSRPADGELTVRVLHREVLGELLGLDEAAVRDGAVAFPKSTLQTARDVRTGRGCLALYLNPLRPDDVFRVTEAGETLPQKSTFFYPKLPTGILFRTLESE
ncbi:MAG: DUF1015 domain-containing protein [Myxococcota bacterium]